MLFRQGFDVALSGTTTPSRTPSSSRVATPHGGSTPRIMSNSGSESGTPRAHVDLCSALKREELMDAYRRVAELQAEKERLEAERVGGMALRVPRQATREAAQAAASPRELFHHKVPPLSLPRETEAPLYKP